MKKTSRLDNAGFEPMTPGMGIKRSNHSAVRLGNSLVSEIYLLVVIHFRCVAVKLGARYGKVVIVVIIVNA